MILKIGENLRANSERRQDLGKESRERSRPIDKTYRTKN
jgi:hypothetical protein